MGNVRGVKLPKSKSWFWGWAMVSDGEHPLGLVGYGVFFILRGSSPQCVAMVRMVKGQK